MFISDPSGVGMTGVYWSMCSMAERMMSVGYMAQNDVRDIHVQNVRLGLMEAKYALELNEYALVMRSSR